jgi:hypothetical protein
VPFQNADLLLSSELHSLLHGRLPIWLRNLLRKYLTSSLNSWMHREKVQVSSGAFFSEAECEAFRSFFHLSP